MLTNYLIALMSSAAPAAVPLPDETPIVITYTRTAEPETSVPKSRPPCAMLAVAFSTKNTVTARAYAVIDARRLEIRPRMGRVHRGRKPDQPPRPRHRKRTRRRPILSDAGEACAGNDQLRILNRRDRRQNVRFGWKADVS